MTRHPPLDLEALETRLVPAGYGVAWPAPEQLTLSFVPDGTRAAGQESVLHSWGSAIDDWKSAILRAAQTWAEAANLNIGVVEDEGLPLGTAGAIQGDSRFGDIRVAAYPMSDEVLAIGTPFDPLAATHSGDLKFNSRLSFRADGIDLYTVALHELGHALGLEHSDDPDSVMYEDYNQARTGLSASDVAAIRALYGARVDAVGPDQSDSERREAAAPRPHGQPAVIPLMARVYGRDERFVAFAEGVGTDTYRFRVPQGEGTPGALTILAWSSAPTATAPQLTLTDAQGDVLAATVLVNEGGTYVVQLPEAMRGGVFLIRVAASAEYSLGILNDTAEVELNPLFVDVPLTAGQEATGTLTIAASQLTHFVLAADGPATLEVSNSQGEVVGLLETLWGAPVTTTLYLLAGEYRLRLLGEATASVWSASLSDPIGPRPAPVQQTPQPLPVVVGTIGYLWELTMSGAPTPTAPAASTPPTVPTPVPGAVPSQSPGSTQPPTGATVSAPEAVEVVDPSQSGAHKRQASASSERVGPTSVGLERIVPFLVGLSGGETTLRSGTVPRDPTGAASASGAPVLLSSVRGVGFTGTPGLNEVSTPVAKVPPATTGLVLPGAATAPVSDESPTPVVLSNDKAEVAEEASVAAPLGAARTAQTLLRRRLSLVALLTVCTVGMLQRHSRDRQRPQQTPVPLDRAGRSTS